MNVKTISLVAVLAAFTVGCSEKDQNSGQDYSSNEVNSTASDETLKSEMNLTEKGVKEAIDKSEKTTEQKDLNLGEGIPPEKLDSEVKELVEKITADSEMSPEDAAKLEQDLKGVFKQIEEERQK